MKTSYLLLGVALIAFAGPVHPGTAQPSQERLIHRLPVEQNEPVKITEVKVNGQSVSFDKKFVAADDWLRSLAVSIKNKSDKLILFASIQLQFPRSPESKERISVSTLSTGNAALEMRVPTPEEKLIGIGPGETADIQISVQEFVGLREFLNATGYPASIHIINLRINRVIFQDDTMWRGGTSLLRDSKVPGKWTPSDLVGIK